MKRVHYLLFIAMIIANSFFFCACNTPQNNNENIKQNVLMTDTAVTNPLFTIAPIQFADSSEKAFKLMAAFNFEAWAKMLADTVVYSFPDGDAVTRTTLHGKNTLINWWKIWKVTSGIQSMTMNAFNHVPINVISQPRDGFPMGIYDLVYFTNTLIFKNKPVGLRMNFSVHFNADKKIDHYASYYDRNVIIEAAGNNLLKK